MFLGKRLPWQPSKRTEIHNSVGFFMYTTCKQNEHGTWPLTMGAFPPLLVILIDSRYYIL